MGSMTDDQEKVETTIAFALQLLGGELVDGEPAAEGSMLWHLERLGALVHAGEMTEEELQAELVRLEGEMVEKLQPPLLTAADLPATPVRNPHARELPDSEAVLLDPVMPEEPEDDGDGE